MRELSQHLIPDGRDAVNSFRRRDQPADLALLIVGQARAPSDRGH
jgi:hypothetical protein